MAGKGVNRSSITLPSAVSNEIIKTTLESSAVMRLARNTTLPGSGMTIPILTGDPVPEWVGETEAKTASNPSFSTKLMTGRKLAVIVPFSNEFARDMSALYDAIVDRLPAVLANKFDATVFGKTAPGDNFDVLGGATAQNLKDAAGVYSALVSTKTAIATAGFLMNGVVLSPQGEGILLGATDTTGRPLFNASVHEGAPGNLLGASTILSKGAYVAANPASFNTVGIAGDWSQAVVGIVQAVNVDVSKEATIMIGSEQINLWQRNMFAVLAEIEVGFRCNTAAFNLLTVPAE